MINLFENFDHESLDFLRSQIIAKVKIPSVAINDDGFLPTEVDSPFKYFCSLNDNHLPLHFDEIAVPKYWRITGDGRQGQVLDLTKKRADIIYARPDNQRIVKAVRWLADNGQPMWIDHYDQHGHRFAKTICWRGRPTSKEYFDKDGLKVVEHNLQTGDVFLNFAGHKHHFASLTDFVIYYLNLRHYNVDRVNYNTLNLSLNVSMHLPADGEDTLFWHEPITNELPGNMKYLMEHQTRTKHIVFQRRADWLRKDQLVAGQTANVDFSYLGMIYPHPRSNKLRPSALILTNSDQIVGLDQLIKLLPNVHFNIAAVTEMSPKLLALQDFANVDTYPNVSGPRLKALMNTSDIYLDINRGNEILDAVRGAFEQNMLILGFEDTLHHPDLVSQRTIFAVNDVRGMAQTILGALVKPQQMKELIDDQRAMAGDATVDDYQKMFM